mgnify:CR=1 FL=1
MSGKLVALHIEMQLLFGGAKACETMGRRHVDTDRYHAEHLAWVVAGMGWLSCDLRKLRYHCELLEIPICSQLFSTDDIPSSTYAPTVRVIHSSPLPSAGRKGLSLKPKVHD